jgi:hypothetical protein
VSLVDYQRSIFERAWNDLIPARALNATVIPERGVRYLHPTKGYRIISKRRFAVRGVY